jgi:hypothetical protein
MGTPSSESRMLSLGEPDAVARRDEQKVLGLGAHLGLT